MYKSPKLESLHIGARALSDEIRTLVGVAKETMTQERMSMSPTIGDSNGLALRYLQLPGE